MFVWSGETVSQTTPRPISLNNTEINFLKREGHKKAPRKLLLSFGLFETLLLVQKA